MGTKFLSSILVHDLNAIETEITFLKLINVLNLNFNSNYFMDQN